MTGGYRVAVVGATGVVGTTMLELLRERRFPVSEVVPFATERSVDTQARSIATEDIASILLRFEDGAHGALSVSQISPGRKNSLQWEIDGSTGSAAWDSETPDHLWLGHRDRLRLHR